MEYEIISWFFQTLEKVGFQKPSPDRSRISKGFHAYQNLSSRDVSSASALHRVSSFPSHAGFSSKLSGGAGEIPPREAIEHPSVHAKTMGVRHSSAALERPQLNNPGLISSVSSQSSSRAGKIIKLFFGHKKFDTGMLQGTLCV